MCHHVDYQHACVEVAQPNGVPISKGAILDSGTASTVATAASSGVDSDREVDGTVCLTRVSWQVTSSRLAAQERVESLYAATAFAQAIYGDRAGPGEHRTLTVMVSPECRAVSFRFIANFWARSITADSKRCQLSETRAGAGGRYIDCTSPITDRTHSRKSAPPIRAQASYDVSRNRLRNEMSAILTSTTPKRKHTRRGWTISTVNWLPCQSLGHSD